MTPQQPSAAPTPTQTLVLEPTASTWADLLQGGTVATTAAAPSITPTVLARRLAAPALKRRAAAATAKKAKVVYLTFDDGPSDKYTKQVLALLARYHAHATFFVIGRQVNGNGKKLVRAEYAAGNGVGNHTWNHQSLAHMKWTKFRGEVNGTQRAVRAATGHAPVCLRPPGGVRDRNTRKRAKSLGLRVELWSVDPSDWRDPPAKTIAHRVLSHTHDGSIVLMHDGGGNRKRTVAALAIVLKTLSARGYTFAPTCR